MSENKGVKELSEVVECCVAMVNCGIIVAKDKKVSLDDLPALMSVIPKVIAAVEGVKEIPAEIHDLSTAEAGEVIAGLAAGLAIENEKAKLVVQASLKTMLAVKELVESVIELKK